MVDKFWLDKPLIPLPVHVGLFCYPEDFEKERKKRKIPPCQYITDHAQMCVHTFENDETGMQVKCICVDMRKMKGQSTNEIIAMLVHEVIHVWQGIKEYLGERSPSNEFEAYAIQHLTLNVLELFAKQHESRRPTRKA